MEVRKGPGRDGLWARAEAVTAERPPQGFLGNAWASWWSNTLAGSGSGEVSPAE